MALKFFISSSRGRRFTQAANFSFAEDEIGSYFRLFVAPSVPLKVSDGKAQEYTGPGVLPQSAGLAGHQDAVHRRTDDSQ